MKCLNCGYPAPKKYCPSCGQKTSTHRFTLASIFDYAILNAYFSLNAGLLFTLKELFLRPGNMVREYLEGKRMKYLNAFSLYFIMLAFSFFIDSFWEDEIPTTSDYVYIQLRTAYPRFFITLSIPFLAVAVSFAFRKIKFNFAEHLISATYLSSVIMLISDFVEIIHYFLGIFNSENTYFILYSLSLTTYFIYFYCQLFRNLKLKKRTIIFRILFALILFLLFNLIFVFLLELKPLFS